LSTSVEALKKMSARWSVETDLYSRPSGIGVNPAGDAWDTSPSNFGLRGTIMDYVPPNFVDIAFSKRCYPAVLAVSF